MQNLFSSIPGLIRSALAFCVIPMLMAAALAVVMLTGLIIYVVVVALSPDLNRAARARTILDQLLPALQSFSWSAILGSDR